MTDEATDCSNKEQLCIAIRYVEPETASIREDLITFLECDSGIAGKTLADKMLGFIRNHLDPSTMRGFRPMTELVTCTERQTELQLEYLLNTPLALYTHCTSHCLNLAVVHSFEEVSVRNMIGVVKQLSIFFFARPKHQKKLQEAVQNTQPESNVLKLKDLCRTRWIERIDALGHIKKLDSSIVACFENISAEGSRMWFPDSVTDASTLLLVITRKKFISALVITNESLQYLRGLTTSLQEEAKDIV